MGMEPEDVYRSDVAGCDGATWAEQIPATRLAIATIVRIGGWRTAGSYDLASSSGQNRDAIEARSSALRRWSLYLRAEPQSSSSRSPFVSMAVNVR